ncbi:Calcineurin-like phosphoesterase [Friedmanniella luteola]|uniref:Calcineurin-like phosphoesterase n=1 Tax=Friedmanniella luteola TaxID=546871 RepID=A0A1H1YNN6_9ACTN|nr:metallophosphoesterase [Friedmanniella luteola]SDT22849.1 Calcineurin-like phosphoesterase [Friedmanniella luteola]
MSRPPRALLPLLVAVGAVAGLVAVPGASPAAAAVAVCSDLSTPVQHRVKPATGTGLLTTSSTEADRAVSAYGFTGDRGTAFRASATARSGLAGLHRLYAARTGDFLYSTDASEVRQAVSDGYADQGVRFHVATSAASCLTPVERWTKGGRHQMVTAPASTKALTAAGWRRERVAFYARPATTATTPVSGQPGLVTKPIATTKGTTFSFAAVPDTQQEVVGAGDTRMTNRSSWVLQQKQMSFVLQTGDLVNWDTPDHAQWARAKRGLAPLEKAKLPYTFAVGNHDTMATGVGGSARDATRSHTLLRDTDTLNSYFDAADFRGVGGAFEAGKVDNVYTLYSAGGLKWMVLTLEFCPRAAVVAWAKKVVASHPTYNVIISTHYYLTKAGKIGTTNSGYGDTSPDYVWKNLVRQYPNIKLVFSGHVGKARKARVDTGLKGNKVYSFLTTMHDRDTNPTRLVTIDTKARTLKTNVYAPKDKKSWAEYTQTIKGLTFVR